MTRVKQVYREPKAKKSTKAALAAKASDKTCTKKRPVAAKKDTSDSRCSGADSSHCEDQAVEKVEDAKKLEEEGEKTESENEEGVV